jgi:ketosteroid isomerase-like protein
MASPAISALSTLPNPITGYEDLRDLTHPRHALTQFYRAFNTRDLVLMRENWAPSDDTCINSPLDGSKRGWQEIRRVYERIFSGPARITVEFYNYTLHVAGDIFYAIGRERGRYESPATVFELAFRTTRIFRFLDQRWRQVHHHGSIDDPALLDRFQSALRPNSSDRFYASAALSISSAIPNL